MLMEIRDSPVPTFYFPVFFWYNLIIQYYYIIYRDAQPTSSIDED